MTSSNDAFVSNAYLEEIKIESNPRLRKVSLSAFSRLPYLKRISLANNSIESINENVNPTISKVSG